MTASGSALVNDKTAAALSPQQFHARVEAVLRAAIAARSGDVADGEAELRVLADLLAGAPALGPGENPPPSVSPLLVGGVRYSLKRRRAEAAAGPEQLLSDLLEFLLAFYPQAVPPPRLSEQLEPQ